MGQTGIEYWQVQGKVGGANDLTNSSLMSSVCFFLFLRLLQMQVKTSL